MSDNLKIQDVGAEEDIMLVFSSLEQQLQGKQSNVIDFFSTLPFFIAS